MGVRGSLARQLFALQFLVVLALLGAVTASTLSQSTANFRETQGRRMLLVAEQVAATDGVQDALAEEQYHRLVTFAETARGQAGNSSISIAGADLRIHTATDPRQVNQQLAIGLPRVASGRSWDGVLGDQVVAQVPVYSDEGRMVGVVSAGQDEPGLWESLVSSPGDLLLHLGLGTGIGLIGSLLAARWVKRQTLGLEPREITGLVEHREAMLHGIREGVLGLDQQHRITLMNTSARELLALPDAIGTQVDELADANERLRDVLTGRASGANQVVLRSGRVLVMNRMPIGLHGQQIGAVVTLRDRTELVALQQELDVNRHATDTLRAQAHEFRNELHTIAGLIELGEYDEVVRYVTRANRAHADWSRAVTGRIADPALAALLIAKASLAAERAVGIKLSEESIVDRVDDALSQDLVTVVGNLVDNALDALPAGAGQWVEVHIAASAEQVLVRVRDSGPGIAPELAEEVFEHGFTTKVATQGGQRGIGLALTRQICVRRGGSVSVRNEGGAVFTATLGRATAAVGTRPPEVRG
ncbi:MULTISPECIES: ATP-binding protein [unclassified Crossiella]|uniref:sensor histidine kinase n=1 Tax=unclassified Crossiella TaxID=2620835 RepID=UPI001FFFB4FB|nr:MULTISPECIES: ATP-binding protein [unclassified Crossiella]MCK2236531.1 ATP-binding protein [Crossiella sp. S99.2]MCK2250198.1 ATP-binding protein [Crossiella sp. S99.1]